MINADLVDYVNFSAFICKNSPLITCDFLLRNNSITSAMAGSLAFLYGINEAKLVLAMASVALGSLLGERTAAQLHKYIPFLGNWTNATSTFALHEGTGWLLVAALERYLVTGKLPDIKHMSKEEKKELMRMADKLKSEAKQAK